jgi:hypothetical protein
MPTVSLTGADTVIIAGQVLLDFADADNCLLEYPNDLVATKVGKNGNSIYALNTMGLLVDVTLRLIRGSDDDKFMDQFVADTKQDFAGFELLDGTFTKRVGDGQGNITNDTYILSGGVIKKQVAAKSNVEGDTEQSISIYHLTFANADRAIL